jgi:hypothetical protein
MLVIGFSPNVNPRCDFEASMVNQLRYAGIEAKSSCLLMPTADELTREAIDRMIVEYGADAVLATSLVQSAVGVEKGGSRDTRGGLNFKATGTGYATGYYGGYGAYGVPVVYGEFQTAPVLASIEGEVSILTMLYQTSDATLVYELTTTASDLHSRGDALATITPPIAERLVQDALIRK